MSKIRILITTTSFQDTPGRHHDLLAGDAYDIERARGPLPESAILALVGDYDAILCGDDAFTRPVLQKCLPRLKVLSKYGIGVDKVDLQAATELRIPVTFCPGVNHVTVGEAFAVRAATGRDALRTRHGPASAARPWLC
jgi:lactate dehydrogenase-like 2-hydroxyacid dehydrogenase